MVSYESNRIYIRNAKPDNGLTAYIVDKINIKENSIDLAILIRHKVGLEKNDDIPVVLV